jgi:uncharacterized protein
VVERHTGRRPGGPIRLLTHLRTFGFCFNPVSFYYLYPEEGGARGSLETASPEIASPEIASPEIASPETIVAEVDNTPWGERHCYVLDRRAAERVGAARVYRFEKRLHVSPFLPMDMDYDWRFNDPGRRLLVHMENLRGGRRVFDATLAMTRRALTPAALRSCLLRYPALTATVFTAIYWQALRLWLKRTPFHEHPGERGSEVSGPAPALDERRGAADG